MEYKEGYVAFIDVLGFSLYVSAENNASNTYNLFEFVRKFCYLFNTSPELKVEVSFFSDSIVLSANELEKLIIPIFIAESYLMEKLGLLFRGGICFGKYYHKDGVTFGPAVVTAYKLEEKAFYSRIIIDKLINISTACESVLFYPDIDGYTCINPMGTILNEPVEYAPQGAIYPNKDINETINSHFSNRREALLQRIRQYKGTSVIDKYLWRVRPFNYTCKFLANLPCGEMLYESIGFAINEQLKTMLRSQVITEEDILGC